MNMKQNPDHKVFVVLSRTHTKIWKDNFEPGAVPLSLAEDYVDRDYKKVINQYFSGRNRSQLDPMFAEKIAQELNGFENIYFAGGGKGKASAVHNFATFLKSRHHLIAEHIRAIEDIDAENMSDGELLAVARQMVTQDL